MGFLTFLFGKNKILKNTAHRMYLFITHQSHLTSLPLSDLGKKREELPWTFSVAISAFQPGNFKEILPPAIKQCLKVSSWRFDANGKIAPISVFEVSKRRNLEVYKLKIFWHPHLIPRILSSYIIFPISKLNISTSPKKSNKALLNVLRVNALKY